MSRINAQLNRISANLESVHIKYSTEEFYLMSMNNWKFNSKLDYLPHLLNLITCCFGMFDIGFFYNNFQCPRYTNERNC